MAGVFFQILHFCIGGGGDLPKILQFYKLILLLYHFDLFLNLGFYFI